MMDYKHLIVNREKIPGTRRTECYVEIPVLSSGIVVIKDVADAIGFDINKASVEWDVYRVEPWCSIYINWWEEDE